MTHYEKLAIVLVRWIAMLGVCMGTMGAVYAVLLSMAGLLTAEHTARGVGAAVYLIAGVIPYSLTRPLGLVIAQSLD